MKNKLMGLILFIMAMCFVPFVSANAYYGNRCVYEISYPEYFWQYYYEGESPEKLCEGKFKNDYSDHQTCVAALKEAGEKAGFYNTFKVYIDSDAYVASGSEFGSCIITQSCQLSYDKPGDKNGIPSGKLERLKNASGTYSISQVTDYLHHNIYNIPFTADLASWPTYSQSSSKCPTLYLGQRNGVLLLDVNDYLLNKNLPIKTFEQLTRCAETNGKWVYEAGERGNCGDEDENIEIKKDKVADCDYKLIGAAALKDKDIKLGLNVTKYQLKPSGSFTFDLTFSGNGTNQLFESVYANNQDYYNLNINVPELGSDFYIYINSQADNGKENLMDILMKLACLVDDELYILPIEDYNGKPTYEITDDEDYVKEKEEEYVPEPGPDYNPGDPQTGCEVIPKEIRKWINNILNFVRYVALILVIALGALDFMKAAGSGEPDAMKKAGQTFMKRMIAVVVLFLLPVIVDFILNMVEIYGVPKDNIDCL